MTLQETPISSPNNTPRLISKIKLRDCEMTKGASNSKAVHLFHGVMCPIWAKSAVAGLSWVILGPFILLTRRHDLRTTEKGSGKRTVGFYRFAGVGRIFGTVP